MPSNNSNQNYTRINTINAQSSKPNKTKNEKPIINSTTDDKPKPLSWKPVTTKSQG
jgi:hypothetical protein